MVGSDPYITVRVVIGKHIQYQPVLMKCTPEGSWWMESMHHRPFARKEDAEIIAHYWAQELGIPLK